MVVQHILAVRKGTREVSTLNKDGKNACDGSEDEIKEENNQEIKNEEIIDKKNLEKLEEKSNDKLEKSDEILDKKIDNKSDVSKTELKDAEKNEKTEHYVDENEDNSLKTIEVDEYYVKYRNFSYLHCEWKTEEELMKGDKRIAAKLKRFKQKMANNTNIFENVCL